MCVCIYIYIERESSLCAYAWTRGLRGCRDNKEDTAQSQSGRREGISDKRFAIYVSFGTTGKSILSSEACQVETRGAVRSTCAEGIGRVGWHCTGQVGSRTWFAQEKGMCVGD